MKNGYKQNYTIRKSQAMFCCVLSILHTTIVILGSTGLRLLRLQSFTSLNAPVREQLCNVGPERRDKEFYYKKEKRL